MATVFDVGPDRVGGVDQFTIDGLMTVHRLLEKRGTIEAATEAFYAENSLG